jgi:hypothetical protein
MCGPQRNGHGSSMHGMADCHGAAWAKRTHMLLACRLLVQAETSARPTARQL